MSPPLRAERPMRPPYAYGRGCERQIPDPSPVKRGPAPNGEGARLNGGAERWGGFRVRILLAGVGRWPCSRSLSERRTPLKHSFGPPAVQPVGYGSVGQSRQWSPTAINRLAS